MIGRNPQPFNRACRGECRTENSWQVLCTLKAFSTSSSPPEANARSVRSRDNFAQFAAQAYSAGQRAQQIRAPGRATLLKLHEFSWRLPAMSEIERSTDARGRGRE